MFKYEEKTIYVTRGDVGSFEVTADFKTGDIVRFKVTAKKDCEKVVCQRDFEVSEDTSSIEIALDDEATRLGDVISKPTDYWYEVELNPDTNPQTIIGYDEDGAKILRLFPEGADVNGEDIEVVGKKTLQELVEYALHEAKESGEFDGPRGIQGDKGEPGHTPERGVDYWTETDKQEIVDDVLDAIPNAGGSGELRYCADCHAVTEGGSYYIDANTLNRPDDVSAGTLFVERVPKSYGIDTNLTLNDSGTILRCAYSSSAGTWSEWEYENPPYQGNKVYRTTERYRGYPVYAFLLQTGGFAFGNLNFTTAKGFTDDPDYVAGGWTVISYDRTVIHDGIYGDGMMESAGDYSLDKYVENIKGDFTDNGLSVTFTLKSNSNSIGAEAYMNLVVKFVKQHV
jgi:hypothetical protein